MSRTNHVVAVISRLTTLLLSSVPLLQHLHTGTQLGLSDEVGSSGKKRRRRMNVHARLYVQLVLVSLSSAPCSIRTPRPVPALLPHRSVLSSSSLSMPMQAFAWVWGLRCLIARHKGHDLYSYRLVSHWPCGLTHFSRVLSVSSGRDLSLPLLFTTPLSLTETAAL